MVCPLKMTTRKLVWKKNLLLNPSGRHHFDSLIPIQTTWFYSLCGVGGFLHLHSRKVANLSLTEI